MSAARKAIRQAAVAAIVGANTALGARVTPNRVDPYRHAELPAASVYSRSEAIDLLAEAPALLYRRRLELVVQVVVDGNSLVDDVCDDIAAQVERAMHHSVRLNGAVATLLLSRVEGPELDHEGNRPLAAVNLVWEAVYEDEVAEADEPGDDFELAHVEFDSHAPRTGPEAVADIELEVAP